MRGLNKVMLIGHLGADPEVRHLEQDQVVANFRLATNRSYTNKVGEKIEETEWHRVVSWGKLAEIIEQYVRKGSLVYVEGRLTTRQWQDKDGIERYTTEVRCDSLQMLDRREDSMPMQPSSPQAASQQEGTPQAQTGGPIQPPPATGTPAPEPGPVAPEAGSVQPQAPATPPANPSEEASDDLPF